MEYRKKIYIKGKIISSEDFKKLTNIILENQCDGELNITIHFEDEFEIKSNELDVFNSDYLYEKDVRYINIDFISFDYKKTITFSFTSNGKEKSYVLMKSDDNEWYLSTLKKIEERLSNLKNQNFLYNVFNSEYSNLYLLVVIAIICAIYLLFFQNIKDNTLLISMAVLYFSIILIIAIGKTLFPNNKFYFASKSDLKKTKMISKIKGFLLFVLGIIIPIIIGYIKK